MSHHGNPCVQPNSVALLPTLLVFLAAGCQSPPPAGHSSGRLGTADHDPPEERSGQMYLTDLTEASDRVAESLMRDLNELTKTSSSRTATPMK